MKFFYDMSTVPDHKYEYFTDEEVSGIRIVEATPETEIEAADIDRSLWPVYDVYGPSWEFVECKDIDDARRKVSDLLNISVFERIYDI